MSNRFRWAALAFLGLALAAFQCNISIGGAPTATPPPPTVAPSPTPRPPTPTPIPPTPTPVPQVREVLLADDFSDNSNNWYEYGPDEDGTFVAVQDGVYEFLVNFQTGGLFYYGTTDATQFTDFDLQVEAALRAPSADNNEVAVVFGFEDDDNFYEFGYSRDGFVMIGQTTNGEFQFLQEWTASDVVNLGNSSNSLLLVMVDGFLSAYINEELALALEIPGYSGGFIGFGCGIFEEPSSHCSFDDLSVGLPTTTGLPQGTLVFAEDFSDNSNNWFELEPDENGESILVESGVYHIATVFLPERAGSDFAWGSRSQSLNDFRLVVEALELPGSTDNNQITVLFGITDINNYFHFTYSGDGSFNVGRTAGGEFEFIEEWAASAAINQGDSTNLLEIVVLDGTLTGYINGVQVVETPLPGYLGGDYIGFGCGPFEAPGTECTFDNLQIYEL